MIVTNFENKDRKKPHYRQGVYVMRFNYAKIELF